MGGGAIITSLDVITQLAAAMQAKGLNPVVDDYLYAMHTAIMGYNQEWDIENSFSKQNVKVISPTDLTPILPRCLFRVEFSVTFSGAAPKVHRIVTRGGKKLDDLALNGAALVTGVAQSFDTQLKRGDLFNISFDQDCTIDYMRISEIPINS